MSKDKDNIIPFPGVKLDKMDNDKIDKVNKELLEEKEDITFIEPKKQSPVPATIVQAASVSCKNIIL